MISPAEYEALMTLVAAVGENDRLFAWWEVFALAALGPLLRADVVAIAALDYRPGRSEGTFGLIRPAWAELRVPSGSEMHRDLLDDHPMTPHLHGPRAREVVRVSDLVPDRQWRSMAGHSRMRELIGATHQIGIGVMTSLDRATAAAPIRADGDFSDHEVEVAVRMQTIAVLAERHFEVVERLRRAVGETEHARRADAAGSAGLTAREQVVLSLMTRGRSAQQVATALGISPRTVHKHQENLYRKLGVADRMGAVMAAREASLLD